MSLQDRITVVADPPPDYVRGGLVRRALALGVDLIVAEVLLQLAVALLFPLSGGHLIDTNAVFTRCETTASRPENLEVPPGFEGAQARVCTKSIAGWPTARLFILDARDPASRTTDSFGFALDDAGRITVPFDAAGLQVLVVVLLRWGLERRGWRSPGRKWLSLAVVARGASDIRAALDRRYVLFALPCLPGPVAQLLITLFQLAGGSPAAPLLTVLTFVGALPLTVALLAAGGDVWRHRDAFYDAHAGTTTARLFDGHLEVAPEAPIPFVQYWTGRVVRPRQGVAAAFARPWLSCALAVVLVFVFVAEAATATGMEGQGLLTPIVLFGAASGESVREAGQWYRLATAMFLHAGLAHLLGNLVVLLGAGFFLEGVLGRGWFLAVFLLGGVAASATSVSVHAPEALSLGASGAITAVVAAGLAATFRLADDQRSRWTRAFCTACLLAATQASGRLSWGIVDRAAHIGGAAAGTALGFLIVFAMWPLEARRPRYGRLALGAGLVTSLGLCASIAWSGIGGAQPGVLLVPVADAPKSDDEWVARSAEIVRRYPADWRGHLARATAVGDDAATREQETDAAIADMVRVGIARPKAEEDAYATVGWGRERAGDGPTAERLYGRALAADPAATVPRVRRLSVEQSGGEFQAATEDAETLVQAHPDKAEFAARLSEVLFAAGKLQEAVTAGGKAVSLKPNDEQIARLQGWLEFLAAPAQAPSDAAHDGVAILKHATALDPHDGYAALWLDIASARTGAEGSAEAFDALALAGWPGPVVAFYRGETSEDQLMAAADAASDGATRIGQHCEAAFYVAEWQVMHDARAAAWPRFREAVATCPKTFIEFGSAEAELQRGGAAGAQP